MRLIIPTFAALSLAACTTPPLTGDSATDCLNARNHVNEMQTGVANAQKGLAALVILADPSLTPKIEKAKQLLDLARADLADAVKNRDDLCAPVI